MSDTKELEKYFDILLSSKKAKTYASKNLGEGNLEAIRRELSEHFVKLENALEVFASLMRGEKSVDKHQHWCLLSDDLKNVLLKIHELPFEVITHAMRVCIVSNTNKKNDLPDDTVPEKLLLSDEVLTFISDVNPGVLHDWQVESKNQITSKIKKLFWNKKHKLLVKQVVIIIQKLRVLEEILTKLKDEIIGRDTRMIETLRNLKATGISEVVSIAATQSMSSDGKIEQILKKARNDSVITKIKKAHVEILEAKKMAGSDALYVNRDVSVQPLSIVGEGIASM